MDGFDWHDGDRAVFFGRGRVAEAEDLLGGHGFTLLTTPRALRGLPRVAEAAQTVIDVPPGNVDALAAQILSDGVEGDRIVGLGGGRVIDVAKAVAAALRIDRREVRAMAIPTTLSGAEMTWVHRHAEGIPGDTPRQRPSVVINDPALSASQPEHELAASSLNALGHVAEAQVTTRANPVATLTALEAARRIARGWDGASPDRDQLALASLLAGSAIDSAWYGLHHVLAQTLVRGAGLAHGAANAVLLPHTLGALAWRFQEANWRLGEALEADPATFAAGLCARTSATALSELGVDRETLGRCAEAAAGRPELDLTPPRAAQAELLALYEQAL